MRGGGRTAIRAAVFAASVLCLASGITPASAEKLRLDGGARKLDDPLIASMASASEKAGVDSIIMISIASIIEDAQAMRVSQVISGGAWDSRPVSGGQVPRTAPRSRAAARLAERTLPVPKIEEILKESHDGGVYGYGSREWLKIVSPRIAVARSDTPAVKGKLRIPGETPEERVVLDLRQDPVFATEVAASQLHDAIPVFNRLMHRDPTPGEMLSIHLFGVEVAAKITEAALKSKTTMSTPILGDLAGKPLLRPYFLTTDGKPLTARGLVLSVEVLMYRKVGVARRYLERFRA